MEGVMKKNILRGIFILIIFTVSSVFIAAQNLDINKYIGVNSYVKNLSYNYITKSGKSFNHVLTLYKNVKYQILVFSTNPDITISVLDSIKDKTLYKIEKSVIKEKHYFFSAEFTPKIKSKYNILVKANKSQDFRYYFLATYEVADVKDIPANQNQTILAFDKFAKDELSKSEIQIGDQKYFRRLIGFLYFPSGQYNYRYLYKDNVFMAQSFTPDKDQKLAFYYGNEAKDDARIGVDVKDENLGSGLEEFSSKSFVTKIDREALHTIDLDTKTGNPTFLISYKLIENKSVSGIELALTKPVPERTNVFSVNLAGYVTNWSDKPENYVVIRRYSGSDEANFKLDQPQGSNTFNFDVNIPLLPGVNKLIVEAFVNGEKKTIEKEVVAESGKNVLMVELTWDTPNTDMDLYVVKPDGEVVCFENQNEGNPAKGWLDIDDKDGYGPERFRMDSPKKGNYKIYAHYYNGNISSKVSAKVITGGSVKEYKGTLSKSDKTNSAVDHLGKGQDWIMIGEVEVK
jgi:hypothetical protein